MTLNLSKLRVMVFSVLVFGFISFALTEISLGKTVADSLTETVDNLFQEWDRIDTPGCALGIIKDGKLIYARGYGASNLEYSIPITSKTVFRIGSTSKQFTAMCIALLAEQGKISLEDDIRKFLPEMQEYQKPITFRHLIHHTSGVRDYLTLIYSVAGLRDDDFLTEEEVYDILTKQRELNFTPGDEFLYSNSGYFLLSVIVKRISGKSLREFADEHIFEPLGMTDTHFHDDHTTIVKNRASGYSPQNEGGFRINMTTLDMVGDGGVFTTVEDLYKWDQNFYDNKLGGKGREFIKQILNPGTLNNGEKLDYAFGLLIGDYKGLKIISHGGSFVGFRAEMIRFPVQKFSVILLANLSSIRPWNLARLVADIYLADQFAEEETEVGVASGGRTNFIQLSEEKLKEKTGTFRNPVTGRIWKVLFQDEKLFVKTQGGLQFQIVPTGEREFSSLNTPVEFKLTFEGSNKVRLLQVRREERKPETYEVIEVLSPTLAQLQEYVGDYFSEEVQVTYKVVIEDGKLFLRHANRHRDYPEDPLEPTLKDMFVVASFALNFSRNEKSEVTAFILNAGRVKNIRFIKK